MIYRCLIILNISIFLIVLFITLKRVEIVLLTPKKEPKRGIFKKNFNNSNDSVNIKKREFKNNIKLDLFKKGKKLFKELDCILCHSIDGKGGFVGPDLSHIGSKKDYKYLFKWINNPQSINFNTIMPNLNLNDKDTKAIAYYLSNLE